MDHTVKRKTKYDFVKRVLLFFVCLLLVVVIVVPGVLQLMYKADARVALGHAKTVRMAFVSLAKEQYGKGEELFDVTTPGHIKEGLYDDVIQLSKVPGDFWILETDETTLEVKQFIYQEGGYSVWYNANQGGYKVYRESQMMDTGD